MSSEFEQATEKEERSFMLIVTGCFSVVCKEELNNKRFTGT